MGQMVFPDIGDRDDISSNSEAAEVKLRPPIRTMRGSNPETGPSGSHLPCTTQPREDWEFIPVCNVLHGGCKLPHQLSAHTDEDGSMVAIKGRPSSWESNISLPEGDRDMMEGPPRVLMADMADASFDDEGYFQNPLPEEGNLIHLMNEPFHMGIDSDIEMQEASDRNGLAPLASYRV